MTRLTENDALSLSALKLRILLFCRYPYTPGYCLREISPLDLPHKIQRTFSMSIFFKFPVLLLIIFEAREAVTA